MNLGSRSSRTLLLVAACTATLLTSAVCQQPKPATSEARARHNVASRVPPETLAQLSGSLQQLASKVSPAVVQIEVTGFGAAEESNRQGTAMIVRQHGIGSGVIVDPDGYIMTNAHVVAGAQRIRVMLPARPAPLFDVSGVRNAQVLEANIIGLQKEADLALLKVQANNLPALRFCTEREPQPGELVFAIGSPEGLQNSVTMGVLSSAWRQPDPDNPMVYLQTDAPINPGNSGGPLVDASGAVLGLNTFILTSGGGSQGLGFAIPARVVDFVYRSLRKYGHVRRIEIGAFAQTITPTMADGLGLAQNWGVVISDLVPHGPADVAGVKPDDVVLAIDGHPMLDLTAFAAALYLHPLDEVLKMDVLRGKQKLSFNVPAVEARDRMDQLADVADAAKNHIERLGILGLNLNDELRSFFPDLRNGSGVVVVARAAGLTSVTTGLRPGDVIHSLNRMPVASIEQLRSLLTSMKAGDAAVLRIERQGQFEYVAFEME